MENCHDPDFGFDVISNASSHNGLCRSTGPNKSLTVKRSISWNASPDLFDDNGGAAIVRNASPDIFQCNASIGSWSKTILTKRSVDLFADDDGADVIRFSSPDLFSGNQSVGSGASGPSSDHLFSSMDVNAVGMGCTQSSNIFAGGERTISPDLFNDSDSSRPESVADFLQRGAIVDLSQNGNPNGPVEREAEALTDVEQSLEVANVAADLSGDNNAANIEQSQNVVVIDDAERLLQMCEPNFLLEMFLGSRIENKLPDVAPTSDRNLNDEATTVCSNDEA